MPYLDPDLSIILTFILWNINRVKKQKVWSRGALRLEIHTVTVVDNLPGTDHFALHFTVTLSPYYKSQCHCLLYNYSKTDFQILQNTLSHVTWDMIINYDSNTDTIWCQWWDLFLSVADSCTPKVKWTKCKMKHWFSDDTLFLIYQKWCVYHSLLHSPNAFFAF